MTNTDFHDKRSTHVIYTEFGWKRIATMHNTTAIEAAFSAEALSKVFGGVELGFSSEQTWETRGPFEAVMAEGYEIDGMTRAKA